jgi:hypothetical protein
MTMKKLICFVLILILFIYSHTAEIIGTVNIIPMTGIADPTYTTVAKIVEEEGMTDNYIYTFAKGTRDAAPGEPLFMINGQFTGWPVAIRDNRTLIPLSAAAEAFNTYIYWDGNDYISIETDAYDSENTNIKMYIRQNQAVINGERTPIHTPPIIIDGQPYLPLRFLSEYYDKTVGYVPAGRLSKTTYLEEIHDWDTPKGLAFNPVIWVDCLEKTENAKTTDATIEWLKTEMNQTLKLLTDNLDTAFYGHLASWGVTADDYTFITIRNAINNLYFIGNVGRYAIFQGPFITLVDIEADNIYFYTFGHTYGNIIKADMNNPETFIPMYFAD